MVQDLFSSEDQDRPGRQPVGDAGKDLARLERIHELLKDRTTDQTDNNRLAYYLDANGRYEDEDTLLRLVSGLEKIGALEQVVLLEEPFADDREVDVHDIPLRIAADELRATLGASHAFVRIEAPGPLAEAPQELAAAQDTAAAPPDQVAGHEWSRGADGA